jgi:hypothetical protein
MRNLVKMIINIWSFSEPRPENYTIMKNLEKI